MDRLQGTALSVLPAAAEEDQSKLQPLDLQTAWILLQLSSPPSLIFIYQVRYRLDEYRSCGFVHCIQIFLTKDEIF